jgi:hypothetical protein
MRIVLRLKYTRHENLKDRLLGTGDDHLIEDSPTDYFWGIGANQSGQNHVGKLLEELRDKLSKYSSLSVAVIVPHVRTVEPNFIFLVSIFLWLTDN